MIPRFPDAAPVELVTAEEAGFLLTTLHKRFDMISACLLFEKQPLCSTMEQSRSLVFLRSCTPASNAGACRAATCRTLSPGHEQTRGLKQSLRFRGKRSSSSLRVRGQPEALER